MAASLSGQVKPNGYYTSYWFEYGVTGELGSRSSVQNIGSGYQTLNAPGYIQNLQKNTLYYFRLIAQNESGKAMGATYTFTTMAGNVPVGSLPTTKTTVATAINNTGATINGEITPNQAATSYWFEYGKSKDFGAITAISPAGSGTTKTNVSLPLAGLDTGTTYHYRINAQNQFGTVNGLTMTFKTTGPLPQSAPVVETSQPTAISTSTATLRGTVNPRGISSTYWFEYSTDSLLGTVLLSATPKTSIGSGTAVVAVTAPATALSSKTNYYYRIVTQNSMGITYGNKVTFKTK